MQSPWIVLEFLRNGDLKNFLTVSVLVYNTIYVVHLCLHNDS